MLIRPNITLRKIGNSEALKTHISDKIKKLEQYYHHINACNVVLNYSQRKQEKGKLFHAHIDLTVPRDELVVNHIQNENPYLAVRDAFKVAERRLKRYAKEQNNKHKRH